MCEYAPQEPVSEEHVEGIARQLEKVIAISNGKPGQIDWVIKDASVHFKEPLTHNDVNELLMTDTETKAEYSCRIIEFYERKKDLLKFATPPGMKGAPQNGGWKPKGEGEKPEDEVENPQGGGWSPDEGRNPEGEGEKPDGDGDEHSYNKPEHRDGTGDAWPGHIVEVPSRDEDSHEISWCAATRFDIDILRMRHPEWQTYLVQKSPSHRLRRETFKCIRQEKDESWDQYITRITSDDNLQTATFERVSSEKAVKAEFHALNSLKWPKSSPTPIHPASLDAYEYLVRFDPRGKPAVDLFERLEELKLVQQGNAPTWLVNEVNSMDPAKRDAFAKLNNMPAGMKFIPGVAACGKSTLLRNVILSALFGGCPTNCSPQDAKPAKRKVLYCKFLRFIPMTDLKGELLMVGVGVNNNAAVDTFARSLEAKLNRMELGNDSPVIVRLYSMDSEVDKMTKEKKPDPFDQDAALKYLENPQFSETDLFLASYMIAKATVSMHELSNKFRRDKSRCCNMSLQEAAARYHMQNPHLHRDLEGLLAKIRRGQEISSEDMSEIKAEVKNLYHQFLLQFRGVVCCTPIAASNFQFRTHYSPDLVLVDEGGRLRELELLVLIAWYPRPWIIIGDKHQLGPFIHVDPSMKNEVQSENPFVKQLAYSTLARAIDAGVTDSYMTVNHRSFGNLAAIPSTLIYRDQMSVPVAKNRYPKSVEAFNQFLSQLVPGISKDQSRVMIHFPGS